MRATIAFDATYSVGRELSGVGVYANELLTALTGCHPEAQFRLGYRSQKLRAAFAQRVPRNASRALLTDSLFFPLIRCDLFHGLNQRMPAIRFRRSVCTFHDLFVLTGDYSTRDFRERFAAQAREAASRADLIIAVSAFTAAQVKSLLNVETGRIRVVHHGVRPLPATDRRRTPTVLHVGAIQYRKNIVRLVEAFEAMPSAWNLVLAGAPTGYGAEQALQAIGKSVCRDRIRVTGYVSTEELAELYATSSIFVFPSLDEGFGMPVIEAMAHGTPVIASDRSAIPEVCGKAALLFDPTSVDEIAAALNTLSESDSLRERLTTLGLERSREFSWAKAADKTWGVYRELVPDLD